MIVDGKPTTLEAFDSSVWVRRNGNWLCAAHTETLARGPVRQKTTGNKKGAEGPFFRLH
jgi:hypothetical protein